MGVKLQNNTRSSLDEILSWEWVKTAVSAIEEKLGVDTIVVDVGDVFVLSEAFLITSGRTNRQVKAIVEAIEDAIKKAEGPPPIRIEGDDDYKWVLMDYGDFLVHVFDTKERSYYQLERLWGDRPVISFPPGQALNVR
jgi:ribosome-associated protein